MAHSASGPGKCARLPLPMMFSLVSIRAGRFVEAIHPIRWHSFAATRPAGGPQQSRFGNASAAYQEAALRSLECRRLQLDEIWSFIDAKQKNVPLAKSARLTLATLDVVAIDAETKLVRIRNTFRSVLRSVKI
jgi:hypothetical protein